MPWDSRLEIYNSIYRKIYRKCKLTNNDKADRSLLRECVGGCVEDVVGKGKNLGRVMAMFSVFIVMCSWLYISVTNYELEPLKDVQFIVCQSCLHKSVKKCY